MDSNKVFATIKRYRTQFAMAALLLFTVLTVGVIYWIRQTSEPIAPTAPTSRPSAIVAACTTDFLLQPECLDLAFNVTEEASESAGVATGSADLKPGNKGTFICEGLPGTTTYKFEYRTSESGNFQELSSGSASESAELTIGNFIEVKCTTCAGDYCASATNVAQNCTLNATGRVVVPSPEPSPEPSPVPSPRPSPVPSPVASPRVSPRPSPVPSPTPPPRCDSECNTNSDCPSNLTCSSGRCRNPQCTGESDCTCNVPVSPRPSPIVSPMPEVPVSGSTTQTAGLLVVGLGVIALGFFQFYKRMQP
jgi:hypothetical protein